MKNIEKWLSVFEVRHNKYPIPDEKVDVTAWWIILNYQWYAWEQVLWILWIFNGWRDPIEWDYYTYVTNLKKTKYQLLWYLENNEITLLSANKSNAWLETRFPRMIGSELWILVNPITKQPIHKAGNWVNIDNTLDSYDVYLTDKDIEYNITWSELTQKFNFRLYENWTCDALLKNKRSNWDWIYTINPSWNWEIQVYCDMNTSYKWLTIYFNDNWNFF
jgi:hypothetical protein